MSGQGYRVYPSGFAIPDKNLTSSMLVEGDQKVDLLFQHTLRGTKTSRDFDYFMNVVECALDLFGGNVDWIITQSFNPNLNKAKIEFLIDTLYYLSTGRRTQSIRTWRTVCCEKGLSSCKNLTRQGFSINKEIVVPKDMVFTEPSGIISTWLSFDDGFGDLVETLNIIFGTPDEAVR